MYKLDLERQRNQRSYCQHSLDYRESKGMPEKHILLLHWLRQNLWLCGSQKNCGKFSNRWEYQITLPVSWEICMKVKKQQLELDMERQTDWFKIGKRVHQGCILSLCLFNLHAEHIMWNAGLDKAQTRIKTAGRNINNLRCTDDTILMVESKEELKGLLIKVKEESEKKLA